MIGSLQRTVQRIAEEWALVSAGEPLLKALGLLGVGTVTFRRALAAQAAQAGTVTPEMIRQAEWIAGLELTDKERESTAKEVQESLELASRPCARSRSVTTSPRPCRSTPRRDSDRPQA